mgnify:FL=1
MSIKKRFGEDVVVHWKDRKRILGMPISFTQYFILEKEGEWLKLFCETGVLSSHFEEVQLYKIEDFSINQTLGDKMFNVGSITIKSNDKTAPVFKILRVKNPYKVYELLAKLVARDRRDRNFRWGEFQG